MLPGGSAPVGDLLLGGVLPGGAWSRGVGTPACTEADPPPFPPPERRLLLRTVHILLECILVERISLSHFEKKTRLCQSRLFIFSSFSPLTLNYLHMRRFSLALKVAPPKFPRREGD